MCRRVGERAATTKFWVASVIVLGGGLQLQNHRFAFNEGKIESDWLS